MPVAFLNMQSSTPSKRREGLPLRRGLAATYSGRFPEVAWPRSRALPDESAQAAAGSPLARPVRASALYQAASVGAPVRALGAAPVPPPPPPLLAAARVMVS